MPAHTKSKMIVIYLAIGGVFLSLKNYNQKILYFVILLFCYFGGYRNALISASFRLNKATNLK